MYILEGNIGAGKSTFLRLLEKNCSDLAVVQEPQENWFKPTDGTSLFECFYREPKRWAYTIETLIMACRVKEHLCVQLDKNPNRLMERSVYSGHYCFAVNGFNSGYFSNLEWEAYLRLFDFLVKEQCTRPNGFIYLRVDPDICYNRIRMRDRKGEESLMMDYLLRIHELHEKFMIDRINIFEELKSVPVLVLDGNQDFIENPDTFAVHIAKIRDFVQKIQQLKFKPSVQAELFRQV